jgi:hypothetical protein
MDWTTIMLVLAGIVGVVMLAAVALYFLGYIDWMNRGSH